MYVRDFYSQAKRQFEGCDEAAIFANLTDAVRLLSNKGINDPLLGELELCVCNGCITLPRDVGTVLGIDVCGRPTLIQDQFFKYHVNGPGTHGAGCGVITEMGQVCTFRDPSEPFYLQAEVSSAFDNNKKLRVYGNDVNGRKIFSAGPGGALMEGFLVPQIYNFSQRAPNIPALSSIYRISRERTKDYVSLFAVKATDSTSLCKIGEYEPDETDPTYRRIRVPHKTSVIVKYKKATLQIRNQGDWLNIENYEALRLACRAIKFRSDDKLDQARGFEEEASRILSEETQAKLPSGPRLPQIINDVTMNSCNDTLFYGGGGSW